MEKISLISYIPLPVCLLGTSLDGVDNFMAVAWVTHVENKPPMMGIGIQRTHASAQAIDATGAFSINLPGRALLEAADYAGLVSGKNKSKADLFPTFRGAQVDVPLIENAALCLECRLTNTVALGSHNFYIGEILGAWSDKQYLTNGVPDLKKVEPFFLSMPDNRYWSIGENIAKAWNPKNKQRFEEKDGQRE